MLDRGCGPWPVLTMLRMPQARCAKHDSDRICRSEYQRLKKACRVLGKSGCFLVGNWLFLAHVLWFVQCSFTACAAQSFSLSWQSLLHVAMMYSTVMCARVLGVTAQSGKVGWSDMLSPSGKDSDP